MEVTLEALPAVAHRLASAVFAISVMCLSLLLAHAKTRPWRMQTLKDGEIKYSQISQHCTWSCTLYKGKMELHWLVGAATLTLHNIASLAKACKTCETCKNTQSM
jgi:hypothetical protein